MTLNETIKSLDGKGTVFDNEWRPCDIQKASVLSRFALGTIFVLTAVLTFIVLHLFLSISSRFYTLIIDISLVSFVGALIAGSLFVAFTVLRVRQYERSCKDWLMAILFSIGLDEKKIIGLVLNYLDKNAYKYKVRRKKHLMPKHKAVWFNLAETDLNVRLEFYELGMMRFVKIAVGPMTLFNKKSMDKLTTNISHEFRQGFPDSKSEVLESENAIRM